MAGSERPPRDRAALRQWLKEQRTKREEEYIQRVGNLRKKAKKKAAKKKKKPSPRAERWVEKAPEKHRLGVGGSKGQLEKAMKDQ
jgi:hypothetical protein